MSDWKRRMRVKWMKFKNPLYDVYYGTKAFVKNLPLFLRLAWGWRKWDSHFSISIFVTLLEEHAKDQRADQWHTNSEKRYRQCMTAAKLLEQAYGEYHYPANKYLDKKRKMCCKNGCLTIVYSGNKEMLDKMSNIAYAKEESIKEARKAFAWQYINKHIERMWS